jgi:vancomycin permeability regulator SanA
MRRLPCIQIMPKRKPLPKWPLLIALLPVLWFVGDVVFVSWDAEVDLVASADVIVVLGCNPIQNDVPSPCMQARGGHAADLYRQGYAQNVIATGTPHEVRVLRSVLIENGVPEDAIQTDDKSHDTIQNIVNSGLILQAEGWHSVVLVTEPFHIKRSTLIAHDVWGSEITVYPSPALNSQNWNGLPVKAFNVARDSLSLMLYQMKSLLGQRN